MEEQKQDTPKQSKIDKVLDGAVLAAEDNDAEAQSSATPNSGKSKVKFESALARDEAIAYFEAILKGMKQGELSFKRGDESLTLEIPERIELEVKASRKGSSGKVSFELTWDAAKQGLRISATS